MELDLYGQRFGKLTAIQPAMQIKGKDRRWICVCDCGNFCTHYTANLTGNHSKNCGCSHQKGKTTKHGMYGSQIYKIWHGMKSRCQAPKAGNRKYYLEKGIKVCDEWKNDFMSFYNWAINNGYDEKLQIDRIDSNGNYSPENCRFVTNKVNMRNRSTTVKLSFENVEKTLYEWCQVFGVEYSTALNRHKRGLPFQKVFMTN